MKKTILLVFLTTILCIGNLKSQNYRSDLLESRKAYFKLGIEPTTMMTFGYQQTLNKRLLAYGEWAFSAFRISFGNSDIKTGIRYHLLGSEALKVFGDLNISAGAIKTINFDSKRFAAGTELSFGYYTVHKYLALTAEYERIIINKIDHTDHYRETHYADAKDGWYKGAGGMIQFGIEGGYTIGNNLDLFLELKAPFTMEFNNYAGSPLHINIGIGYRF